MPTATVIACFDNVELIEAIEAAPAGSRGTVVEMLKDDVAMVEVMTMPLRPALDRIVVAPVSKLRRIDHVRAKPPRNVAA